MHLWIQLRWLQKKEKKEKKNFQDEAFEDTQAYWWLFEVERGGKAVQMLPAASGKIMNI